MKRIIVYFICIGITAFASCSYEYTATVTINTGIRTQAHINWFDRVLAFLSLAQPLQADPPEPGLDIGAITFTVTASDMATITQEIPLDTGRITLEVPAGSQRTFEVVAGYSSEIRDYGGICTVDLAAGQQVDLDIHMGKLTPISCIINSIPFRINITYYYTNYPEIIYFKIYQNIGETNPVYRLVETIRANELDADIVQDFKIYILDSDYINNTNYTYYYISSVNQYGESGKCPIRQ